MAKKADKRPPKLTPPADDAGESAQADAIAERAQPPPPVRDTDSRPPIEPDAQDTEPASIEAPPPPALTTATIDVPLAELPETGYLTRHVEVQLERPHQATQRRLMLALDQQGARLKSGRRVQSNADAIKWLLEAIDESNGNSRE